MCDNITQFIIFINQSKRLHLPPHIACEEWFRCKEVIVLFRVKAESRDIKRVCCGKSLCHSGCMTRSTARNSERLNNLILFWTSFFLLLLRPVSAILCSQGNSSQLCLFLVCETRWLKRPWQTLGISFCFDSAWWFMAHKKNNANVETNVCFRARQPIWLSTSSHRHRIFCLCTCRRMTPPCAFASAAC